MQFKSEMKVYRLALAWASIALLLLPTVAAAHSDAGAAGGFISGFMHPVGGTDHVLAMVAVGLWGAILGAPAVWALPVAFPLLMTLGAVAGILGIPLPQVELGIVLSVVVLGIVIAAKFRPNLPLALVVVSFFAIFHGHAHGTELPGSASAVGFSIGFVIATGLLHLAGIMAGLVHRLPWGEKVLQGGGLAITVTGVYLLLQLYGS